MNKFRSNMKGKVMQVSRLRAPSRREFRNALKSSQQCNVLYSRFRASWPYIINPYSTAFPYGNGMVLHFYQQQESSTTKTVHKVINKRLKICV